MFPLLLRSKGYPTVLLPKDLLISSRLDEGFKSAAGFTAVSSPAGGTLADDAVNVISGTNSMKMTTPAASGYIQATKTVNFLSDGNIRFFVYCADTTIPSDASIMLSNDTPGFGNYFILFRNTGDFIFRQAPGWNLMDIKTADWAVGAGAPSWANPIRQLRVKFNTAAAAHEYSIDAFSSNVVAQPAVVLEFDDGLTTQYVEGFSYLQQHKVRGTMFVISDLIDGLNFCTQAQILDMYSAGWTIGNHTDTTDALDTMSEAEQELAIRTCDNVLSTMGIGECRMHVAYPGGAHNDDTLTAMANLGFYTGRTVHTSTKEEKLPMEYPHHLYVIGSTSPTVSLATAQGWIDLIKTRQIAGIIFVHGLSAAPAGGEWYIDRFQALVDYCIAQGVPIITMHDLHRLRSAAVSVPQAK